MKELLDKYIKENLEEHIFFARSMVRPDIEVLNSIGSVDEFVNSVKDENKFQTLLFNFIDSKNLKDSDVYNKVHMDRRLFSKLKNEDYHPSKETVILLGLALELDEKEIEDLLLSASYSLPKNNYYDLIIRFCFVNKIYNIFEVNKLLEDYNCKTI